MFKSVWAFMRVLLLGAVIFFPGGCCTSTQPEDAELGIENPSFSDDIQPIFTQSCAVSGCHGSSTAGGLDLRQGRSYAELVDAAAAGEPGRILVLPGNAGDSYLVIKLEGRQSIGSRMPLGGTPLSAARINTIRNWITGGARDNR